MKVCDGDGKDILNEVVNWNPRSETWRKKEDVLIGEIVTLYNNYTPLKGNISQIAHNLQMIFNDCGISEIKYEALRKRISAIYPALP